MGQNCKVLRFELEAFLTSEIKKYSCAATEYNSNEETSVDHCCNALIDAYWFTVPNSCFIEISLNVSLKS